MSLEEKEQRKLTRREFVKASATGAAAVAGASALAGCLPLPAAAPAPAAECPPCPSAECAPCPAAGMPDKWDYEADVVVVGGGGCGCAAALSAQEAGSQVVLVEHAPYLGGLTSRAVGSVEACLSNLQKQQGIEDSVEAFMEDCGAPATNKELLRVGAEGSGPMIDWLVGMGVDIRGPFEYPHQHRVNRMHMLYPDTSAWPKVLGPLMEQRGIDVHLGTRGTKLYKNADGAVIGIMAEEVESKKSINILARKGVVLAGGDYQGSKEWKQKWNVDSTTLGVRPAHPYNDGSALSMAMGAGADVRSLNQSPGASFRANGAPLYGDGPSVGPNDIGPGGTQAWMPHNMYQAGAIIVNTDGKRFVNEQTGNLALTTEVQPGRMSFIVFDQPVADIFNQWPMVVSSLPGIGEKSGWGGWCSVDDLVYRGTIQVADTIEELVAKVAEVMKVEISSSGLTETIETWNGYAAAGNDPEFKRTIFGVDALKGAGIKAPPFYIHGPCIAEEISKKVTLAVDTQLRVSDAFGEVIPGLYAGGNMGSNMGTGAGHGTSLSWAFTSGRLAGTNVAAETPRA